MLRIRKLPNEPTMTTKRQYVHLNTVQSDIYSSPILIKYYKCALSSHHNHLLIKPYRLLDFLKAQRRAKVCLLLWIVSHGASLQPTLSEYHSYVSGTHSLQQMLFLKNGLISLSFPLFRLFRNLLFFAVAILTFLFKAFSDSSWHLCGMLDEFVP